MKVYYPKQTLKKDFSRSFEESVKMIDENPETFVPDTAELDIKLKSIDIPDHLIEKFKIQFGKKNLLTETEILNFLNENT